MGRIAECDWCGQENTKATEEFEYLPLSQQPNVCWRCGIAVPFIREQIAREIMENFEGGHTKGENDCSCQEGSDPCYFCGAKDYTGIAAAIARGEK